MFWVAQPTMIAEIATPAQQARWYGRVGPVRMAGGQTLTVRLLETYRRTRVLVVAGVIWSGSCVLLALALIVPQLLLIPYLSAVVAVYTCAELMHAPTANALVAEVGPTTLRGR